MSRIIIVLCLFLATHTLHARITEPTFGLYGHFGITSNIVDINIFSEGEAYNRFLQNVHAEPKLKNATGDVWGIGGLYELPLGKEISISFRIGYSEYTTNLPKQTDNTSHRGSTITNNIKLTLEEIALEPIVTIELYKEFNALIGGRVGYISEHSFFYTSVVAGGDYLFNNGAKENSGRIIFPDDGVFLTSFSFGFSYDFRFFNNKNFVLSPEALFSVGMTNFIRGKEWTISPYRFGLIVKYVLPE